MLANELVAAGVTNARSRLPVVDRKAVARRLRQANLQIGRRLGRIEWADSFDACIRRCADLVLEGWTADPDGPLRDARNEVPEPGGSWRLAFRRDPLQPVEHLAMLEERLWGAVLSSHAASRLTKKNRLPVYLATIDQPSLASHAANKLLVSTRRSLAEPDQRHRSFTASKDWKDHDAHWLFTTAVSSLPFLTEIAHAFAAGLLGASTLRRGTESRTILIPRPRLRVRANRLHANHHPAVLWPDGNERWYWGGIEVPTKIVDARDELTAETVAAIRNQELRRLAVERLGWERFLKTADSTLVAQDDYGKLWTTNVTLDGERVRFVEVVNETAEPDGSYRHYFLRVPPISRTAREAVAWTFGFDDAKQYLLAAGS